MEGIEDYYADREYFENINANVHKKSGKKFKRKLDEVDYDPKKMWEGIDTRPKGKFTAPTQVGNARGFYN